MLTFHSFLSTSRDWISSFSLLIGDENVPERRSWRDRHLLSIDHYHSWRSIFIESTMINRVNMCRTSRRNFLMFLLVAIEMKVLREREMSKTIEWYSNINWRINRIVLSYTFLWITKDSRNGPTRESIAIGVIEWPWRSTMNWSKRVQRRRRATFGRIFEDFFTTVVRQTEQVREQSIRTIHFESMDKWIEQIQIEENTRSKRWRWRWFICCSKIGKGRREDRRCIVDKRSGNSIFVLLLEKICCWDIPRWINSMGKEHSHTEGLPGKCFRSLDDSFQSNESNERSFKTIPIYENYLSCTFLSSLRWMIEYSFVFSSFSKDETDRRIA